MPWQMSVWMTVQVNRHLVSRRRLEAVSPALECFPAVLQALTARPLQLPALTERFITDLAAAVTAVTSDEALGDTALSDFKARQALDMMVFS